MGLLPRLAPGATEIYCHPAVPPDLETLPGLLTIGLKPNWPLY